MNVHYFSHGTVQLQIEIILIIQAEKNSTYLFETLLTIRCVIIFKKYKVPSNNAKMPNDSIE
jgi:hypothetical protein